MKQLTVLRTGGGSPPSIPVIRELVMQGIHVVVADADPYSVGLYYAKDSVIIPKANDKNFIKTVIQLCKAKKIDIILPAVDEEVLILSKNLSILQKNGIKAIVPPEEIAKTCLDKLATIRFFKDNDIPSPKAYSAKAKFSKNDLPVIFKPRQGRGSRNIFVANTIRELEFLIKTYPQAIIQEFVEGAEYTIDLLVNYQHEVVCAVPRERILTESGISIKGRTVSDTAIINASIDIVSKLKITGPINIQCIKDKKGRLFFIEINPRLAGGVALSIAAGAPIIKGLVDMFNDRTPRPNFAFKEGLVMLRYWEDIFIDNSKIPQL
jgi:carbamoyl-phosphate synthase large subunit